MSERQLALDFEAAEALPPTQSHLLSVEEIWQTATPILLKKLVEDDRIERKPANIHAPELAQWISMWSNTPPSGGIMAVGIANDGEFVGCSSIGEDRVNRLCQAGHQYCHDAHYEVKRLNGRRRDGVEDFCLLLKVAYHPRRVVTDSKGHAYYRYGDAKTRLTDDQKRQLEADKGQIEFEQEPCDLEWPRDFSLSAVRQFTDSVRRIKRIEAEHTDAAVLAHHRLGKASEFGFVPNIACALLFANDPQQVIPGAMIRFQRIEGERAHTGEARNVVKDIFIEGRLPEMIVETDKVIDSQIRTFSRLGPDNKFYRAREYPKKAWYEAVVNACVHRSYSLKGMNIFVKMFDDRLVVESPGPLPPLVTPENIYHVHHRRNFFLMGALYFLDFVKCENEGTKRMRDSMLDMELPAPEFEQSSKEVGEAFVRVTLRNNSKFRERWIDADASPIVGAILASTLDKHENRIINFVAEHGEIKAREAERLTGKTWHTAKKILMRLVDRKILVYHSKFSRDPNARFTLNKGESDSSPSPP